jgi:hypothetical protein
MDRRYDYVPKRTRASASRLTDTDAQGWDLYAGVMIVDLALAQFRLALSGDFESYAPISTLDQLASLHSRE